MGSAKNSWGTTKAWIRYFGINRTKIYAKEWKKNDRSELEDFSEKSFEGNYLHRLSYRSDDSLQAGSCFSCNRTSPEETHLLQCNKESNCGMVASTDKKFAFRLCFSQIFNKIS